MQFSDFWQAGYRRLVPIVPPGATISPRSTLAKRPGAVGKAVGVRGRDGAWMGFDWVSCESDETDLRRWSDMGAGVGIRTGDGLVAIDADTTSPAHAAAIRDAIQRVAGRAPVRVGAKPKALYPIRTDPGYRYARVEFAGSEADPNARPERVEVLADGRQFVAAGTHPGTGRPYEWPRGVPRFDDLPRLTHAQIDALLEELRQILPKAQPITREGPGSDKPVDQSALRGDPALVRKAVEATPNSQEFFPNREHYLVYGYAIKAALPDDDATAFDLWAEWCARWDGGNNDPDVIAADWRRMKPPYRRGAAYLYEIAERTSGGKFHRAEAWFDDLTTDPFAEIFDDFSAAPSDGVAIRWVDPAEWAGVEPPTREWVVENWMPKGEVTLLYGDGGVGKTLLAHQAATCIASGAPWLGQPTQQGRVMCFFCEDSEDELLRRQIDINRNLGLTFADSSERLRIASRKYMDNLFVTWDRATGAMRRGAVWAQLLADAKAFKADVIVVDTLADVYSGSEIDRAQVNAFVKSCLGRLAQETGGSVLALGHPSMAGKSSGSGTSGSTAWSNAARSRLYLRYPDAKGAENGRVRELEAMKSNYGPRGSLLKIEWRKGAFELLASSIPNQGAASISASAEEAVLNALRLHDGEAMRLSRRSPKWAGKVLRALEPDLLAAVSADELSGTLDTLEATGRVFERSVGWSEGNKVVTVQVRDEPGGAAQPAAVDLFA